MPKPNQNPNKITLNPKPYLCYQNAQDIKYIKKILNLNYTLKSGNNLFKNIFKICKRRLKLKGGGELIQFFQVLGHSRLDESWEAKMQIPNLPCKVVQSILML